MPIFGKRVFIRFVRVKSLILLVFMNPESSQNGSQSGMNKGGEKTSHNKNEGQRGAHLLDFKRGVWPHSSTVM